jgi:hypothetical protein
MRRRMRSAGPSPAGTVGERAVGDRLGHDYGPERLSQLVSESWGTKAAERKRVNRALVPA